MAKGLARIYEPSLVLILSVSVVGLARPLNPFLRRLLRLLGILEPSARFWVGRFVNKKSKAPEITRDQDYHEALRKKSHHIKEFSLEFLLELGDLIYASASFAPHWEVPTLVLAAGLDCFVKTTHLAVVRKNLCSG